MKRICGRLKISVVLLTGLSAGRVCLAKVTLPSLWSDHVVVQRGMPVQVWGMAGPGEKISAHFRNATSTGTADNLGRWEIDLPPGEAGGPFTMEIQGENRIILSDILVGDVWVASGQSNMEFGTKGVLNAEEELKGANQPTIRLFHVDKRSSDFPQDDVLTKSWVLCTPETVADFSAVAYFFARNIQADQNVPIGLIEADWGGTPGETWTSLKALSQDGSLMPAWATWADLSENESAALLEQAQEDQERKAALAAGKPEPKFPWRPELRSWLPGGAFNGMIAPLVKFRVRGFLWYQGESNAEINRYFYYDRLLRTLIQDWRQRWNEGDIPFLIVQLANFITSNEAKWPELREAQRRTLSVNQTGMAVTIDIGDPDNIHPKNKQEVGRRLSLAARALAYHETLEYSGPLYRTEMRQGSTIRLYFDHADSGLVAKGDALNGFEIADSDGKFVPAQASIDGKTVVVSSPQVKDPRAVRYGWVDNPLCNLYNKDDLPASPFSSL
ncbi:MAG: sialate O-acetylesterase [Terriglobales bacterium]